MKKTIILFLFLLIISGCGKKDSNETSGIKKEEKTATPEVKDSSKDAIKSNLKTEIKKADTEQEIYIPRIDKYVKVKDFKDENRDVLGIYTGVYSNDKTEKRGMTRGDYQQIIVNIKGNLAKVYINYYENGTKVDATRVLKCRNYRNTLTGKIQHKGVEEDFSARFVFYTYKWAGGDNIYGLMREFDGRYIFYESDN